MSKVLVKQGSNAPVDLAAGVTLTGEDVKNYFCPKASEKEVVLALGICKSAGLNPFIREVHFVKYDDRSPMQIVTGYDVYIKRAERTGKLNGWKAWLEDNKAKIVINRKDWDKPFEWEVDLSEFNKNQSTWKQIPSFMGKKVVISQGFRLCFPDELGGLPYTQEETEVYDINAEENLSGKPAVEQPKSLSEQAASAASAKKDAPPRPPKTPAPQAAKEDNIEFGEPAADEGLPAAKQPTGAVEIGVKAALLVAPNTIIPCVKGVVSNIEEVKTATGSELTRVVVSDPQNERALLMKLSGFRKAEFTIGIAYKFFDVSIAASKKNPNEKFFVSAKFEEDED